MLILISISDPPLRAKNKKEKEKKNPDLSPKNGLELFVPTGQLEIQLANQFDILFQRNNSCEV